MASQVRRNLHFMVELRRLFALMVASKRKYVDPSRAVEILKEAFTDGGAGVGSVDSQQVQSYSGRHSLEETGSPVAE